MAKDWVNFYLPEHYQGPVKGLRDKLPGSFSKAMQECLRELFKKYRVPFDENPKQEQ